MMAGVGGRKFGREGLCNPWGWDQREKRDYGAGDETGGSMTEVPKKGYGSVFSLLVLVGVALG